MKTTNNSKNNKTSRKVIATRNSKSNNKTIKKVSKHTEKEEIIEPVKKDNRVVNEKQIRVVKNKQRKIKIMNKQLLWVILGLFVIVAILIVTTILKKSIKEDEVITPNEVEKAENVEEVKEVSKFNIIDTTSKSRPFAIVINNYPVAMKAQTGLNDAYMIYEFPIEGGYSRSVALFKDKNTSQIGTVRSVRQYHPYFAFENDAILVHWGANHPGYDAISNVGIDHIDELSNSGPFFRKNPYNLATEHTGYTSLSKLKTYVENKKIRSKTDTLPPLNYSNEDIDLSSIKDSKKAKTIELNYSNSYKLKYTYNNETKRYERYYNGKKHDDYISGNVFDTKNIIIAFVKIGKVKDYKDAAGTNYLDMTVTGSGKGWYITNGYAREITWTKESKTGQSVYKYTDGTEINVNDGRTYINFFNKSKTASIK
jgi:hypothetical protein